MKTWRALECPILYDGTSRAILKNIRGEQKRHAPITSKWRSLYKTTQPNRQQYSRTTQRHRVRNNSKRSKHAFQQAPWRRKSPFREALERPTTLRTTRIPQYFTITSQVRSTNTNKRSNAPYHTTQPNWLHKPLRTQEHTRRTHGAFAAITRQKRNIRRHEPCHTHPTTGANAPYLHTVRRSRTGCMSCPILKNVRRHKPYHTLRNQGSRMTRSQYLQMEESLQNNGASTLQYLKGALEALRTHQVSEQDDHTHP